MKLHDRFPQHRWMANGSGDHQAPLVQERGAGLTGWHKR